MAEKTARRGVSMNLLDIQKLITMLEKSTLHELELETGDTKIHLSKGTATAPSSAPQFLMMPSPGLAPGHSPVHAPLPVPASAAGVPETSVVAESVPALPSRSATSVEVKSPMVGTFYRAPAPGAEPFAKVGSRVKKGQTLCIIEAMKLMNEIECEMDGVVVEVLTENAQPVEYGEVLMHIDPNG
jgi:acetyl-CoA carboxylase biotin carboxyl carrier protein